MNCKLKGSNKPKIITTFFMFNKTYIFMGNLLNIAIIGLNIVI